MLHMVGDTGKGQSCDPSLLLRNCAFINPTKHQMMGSCPWSYKSTQGLIFPLEKQDINAKAKQFSPSLYMVIACHQEPSLFWLQLSQHTSSWTKHQQFVSLGKLSWMSTMCHFVGIGHTQVSKRDELISWQLWEWFSSLQGNTGVGVCLWPRYFCFKKPAYLLQEILPYSAYKTKGIYILIYS